MQKKLLWHITTRNETRLAYFSWLCLFYWHRRSLKPKQWTSLLVAGARNSTCALIAQNSCATIAFITSAPLVFSQNFLCEHRETVLGKVELSSQVIINKLRKHQQHSRFTRNRRHVTSLQNNISIVSTCSLMRWLRTRFCRSLLMLLFNNKLIWTCHVASSLRNARLQKQDRKNVPRTVDDNEKNISADDDGEWPSIKLDVDN